MEGREPAAPGRGRAPPPAAPRRKPPSPSPWRWRGMHICDPVPRAEGAAAPVSVCVAHPATDPGEPQTLPIYVDLGAPNRPQRRGSPSPPFPRGDGEAGAPPRHSPRLLAISRSNNLPADLQDQLRQQIGAKESITPGTCFSHTRWSWRVAERLRDGLELINAWRRHGDEHSRRSGSWRWAR